MPELPAFVCVHVFRAERPVLYVAHDEDGDWTFACGDEHEQTADNWFVIGLRHLLERDPSIDELRDLPQGREAERTAPESAWKRRRLR